MKFWLRWIANGIAIFLALYLVDSLLHDRFHFVHTWPAVVAAVVLGFGNTFVRPLHRAKAKPLRAALTLLLTIIVNTFILQLFVWVGADLTSRGVVYVLLAAVFVVVITGLINSQIGFGGKEKRRVGRRERPERRTEKAERRPARP